MEQLLVIAAALKEQKITQVVVDPVMAATSGRKLSGDASGDFFLELFAEAALITPNIPEAARLLGEEIRDKKEVEQAAASLAKMYHTAVLIKGGHADTGADDYLFTGKEGVWFPGTRLDNTNTHGTGCTLSSAIACGLAEGFLLKEAVRRAKEYLTGAIAAGLDLGHGNGPLDHMYRLWK